MNHSLLTEQDSYILRMRLTTLADFEHQLRVRALAACETPEQRRERVAVAALQGLLASAAGVAWIGDPQQAALEACRLADALTVELDKRAAGDAHEPGSKPEQGGEAP